MEPRASTLRPRTVRSTPRWRQVLLVGASLVALAGCGQRADTGGSGGSGAESPASPSGSTPPTPIGSCRPEDPALLEGSVVARVDLDGDGTAEAVRRTTSVGCAGALVARVDGRTVGALPEDPDLPLSSARAVTLPGRSGQLLVVEASHPRGGTSASVLAFADGRLALLERPGGAALVPFRATDVTPSSRMTLSCGPRSSLVLREAVTHEPVGILAAFDVRETTYRLRDAILVAGGTTEVADNVLPDDLAGRFPAIAERRVLVDGCK